MFMAKAAQILGMNARQKLFVALNTRAARKFANSKLALKKLMKERNISVPETYARFRSMDKVRDFDFFGLKTSFVIKPATGSGGKGIMIIRRRGKEKPIWTTVDGKVIKREDVELHINDILEGQYSTFGTSHRAFVEEWVGVHPKLKKYVYKGTPDIRVIVYNSVPVMAMLRLPTEESEGKANLHQGAIGVGIDIATGVTLSGVYHGRVIKRLPESKKKLNGVIIPKWTVVLRTAVEAVEAAKLAYCGVDLFVQKDKGPMVVELNAMPGLGIQVANKAGLKRRLERVEGLEIRNADHGVKVGKALFAERFADRVKADEGLVIINNFEKVKIRISKKKRVEVLAKVDTGAFRSSIDKQLAKDLGLLERENILWEKKYVSALGRETRKVIQLTFFLKGVKLRTAVSVANRKRVKSKLLIGRRDLGGFLVSPEAKKDVPTEEI